MTEAKLKDILQKYSNLFEKYSENEKKEIIEYLFTLVNILLREDIEKK